MAAQSRTIHRSGPPWPEPDRFRLADLAERVRSGRLKPIIGAVRPLAEVPSAFAPDRRVPGKTIIQVTEGR